MSGHNRWTKIKRHKAAVGAAKGKFFSKAIKEITVAAKLGGGDPDHNARLRAAISAAREGNMPQDNITRAIKKGTGELEGVAYEDAVYEAYGPGGVALLIECLTDNKNRTASDIRSALGKYGGNLANPGALKIAFNKVGVILVKPGPSEDQVMEKAIEAGAEDVINQGEEGFEIRTQPAELHHVGMALEKAGLKLGEQKWSYLPLSTVHLEGDKAKQMLKLMEVLDDLDDIQNLHANFEMDESLMQDSA